jgi:hypothetical protein
MRLILASSIIAASAALTVLAAALPASADTRSFNLAGFKRIEASKGFTIEFTQASAYSVVVDSKHNNLDMIIVEKVGDTLRITRPESTRNVKNVEDIVRISAPDIEELDLHAAVTFNAGRLDLDKLVIDGNAATRVTIADLRVDTLRADMDAASRLDVAGTCSKLSLRAGAATKVDTKNFKCREADIDAGVASRVHAFASERAKATAGVSSTVMVSGKPAKFEKSADRLASSISLTD